MNKPIKKFSLGFYVALFAVIGFVILAGWPDSSHGASGSWVKSMNNVRQIGLALHVYAKDNDGKLPSLLSALSPDYLDAGELPKLRFIDRDGRTALDWLYFPKADINALPDAAILVASPRTRHYNGKDCRMVLHRDFSITTMPETDFQKQLAEELRMTAP